MNARNAPPRALPWERGLPDWKRRTVGTTALDRESRRLRDRDQLEAVWRVLTQVARP